MNESVWRLADYYQPVGEEEEFPEYLIRSDEDLRRYLHTFVDGPPRIVELYSPNEDFLRIGIGGSYAGLAWIKLPIIRMLVNPKPLSPTPVVFEIQGQPCTLRQDELHSPEVIIDTACQYFLRGSLPESLVLRDAS